MQGWSRPKGALIAVLAGLVFTAAGGVALAGSSSTTLPNGAELTVSIDSPLTSTEYVIPAGAATRSVQVSGSASVGLGEPDATFIYVIDGSGSTSIGGGTGCAPVLQCEQQFVVALNTAAGIDGSVDEVGVVVFGEGGVTADMSPAAGDQPLTAPNAGPGNVTTVVNSTTSAGGVGQFAAKGASGDFTNFTAGLQSALTLVTASTNSTNIVIFLSDGASNLGGGGFATAVTNLATAGAVVQSIAVGTGTTCSARHSRNAPGDGRRNRWNMPRDRGSRRAAGHHPRPDQLEPRLLTISVDGGAATSITTVPALPQPGASRSTTRRRSPTSGRATTSSASPQAGAMRPDRPPSHDARRSTSSGSRSRRRGDQRARDTGSDAHGDGDARRAEHDGVLERRPDDPVQRRLRPECR